MDNDLLCNLRKCRKRLNSFSWVTSCSHINGSTKTDQIMLTRICSPGVEPSPVGKVEILGGEVDIFCDEDGTREFNKAFVCPACDGPLSGKFDIVRVDLNLSDQYKSMILAGQRPETIMEICSRALSFWTYQAFQESSYQAFVATKAKEKSSQLEHYYEQLIAKTQQEINSLKSDICSKGKELEETKKRLNEASEKLQERSRQHQKLQVMYDSLRRKSMNQSVFHPREQVTGSDTGRMKSSFDLTLGTAADLLARSGHSSSLIDLTRLTSNPIVSFPEKEFVWKPMAAGEYPIEIPRTPSGQDTGHHRYIDINGSGIKRRLGNKKGQE